MLRAPSWVKSENKLMTLMNAKNSKARREVLFTSANFYLLRCLSIISYRGWR
jgi:hypothetical protein